MNRLSLFGIPLSLGLGLALLLWLLPGAPVDAALNDEFDRLDQRTPGRLGVYVKRLDDGELAEHDAERPWYLASAIKVPVAIAVLQLVQEGQLNLNDELQLRDGDRVDSTGGLVWAAAGSRYSLTTLLREMLRNSDSTAADMLIRRVGEDELNRRVQQMSPSGFGRITTLLQVRYDVYGELHEKAAGLSNRDILQIASVPPGDERLELLAEALGVERGQLKLGTLREAYERYYRRGLNSSTLPAYATLLERLVRGELLDAERQAQLFAFMGEDEYHDYRLQAGLPQGLPFIQKTGTQYRSACHMGVIRPEPVVEATVVVACVEDANQDEEAPSVLEAVGEAVYRAQQEVAQQPAEQGRS
ncbi:serine hydrolase [Pseudomonas sp.]|uniref:serine hydrolase n=1 Tax=Pseudomonas sp. TaxID=306 RepID=UPI0028AB1AAB|nr:serine hydrolase [Pseudomonas sp.]